MERRVSYSRLEFRIASTGLWVPVSDRDPLDEDAIKLYGVGPNPDQVVVFDYSEVAGPPWNQNKLDAAKKIIQEQYLDGYWLLEELQDNHPWKYTDPGLNSLFWEYRDWGPFVPGTYYIERHSLLFLLTYNTGDGLTIGLSDVRDF